MTRTDPARVLRRAVLGWGLGHLDLGRQRTGIGLLVAEAIALALLVWLTVGLAGTSLYLVPFLWGVGFIVVWAVQAVHAYRLAQARSGDGEPPSRSPALGIGWLSVPLLAWGAGFWLFGTEAATPAAVLDRFLTDWHDGTLDEGEWPPDVVAEASAASDALGRGARPLRDLRVRIEAQHAEGATAVAEAIHFERRESRFLWIFPGSDLVPVADRRVLTLQLAATPTGLPGGGEIGAVRWTITDADRP